MQTVTDSEAEPQVWETGREAPQPNLRDISWAFTSPT